MSFGDVIREVGAGGNTPLGIGGSYEVIWYYYPNLDSSTDVHALSVIDLSLVNSGVVAGMTYFGDVGGDLDTIWYCEANLLVVGELASLDFSIVRSATPPGSNPVGIGGSATVIWHGDQTTQKIYKLSTTDFSVISSGDESMGSPYVQDSVGGTDNVIYSISSVLGDDKIHELSVLDYSVIQSATTPYVIPVGVGGDPTVIWYTDQYHSLLAGKICELDTESGIPLVTTDAATSIAATTATLNGTLVNDRGIDCDCSFDYGETTSYGTSTTPEVKNTGESFSAAIGTLLPGTTYHFRAKATNTNGTGYGIDRTFETLGVSYPPSGYGRVGSLIHRRDVARDIYTLEITFGGVSYSPPSSPVASRYTGGGPRAEDLFPLNPAQPPQKKPDVEMAKPTAPPVPALPKSVERKPLSLTPSADVLASRAKILADIVAGLRRPPNTPTLYSRIQLAMEEFFNERLR